MLEWYLHIWFFFTQPVKKKTSQCVTCISPWISFQLLRRFLQRWSPAGLRSPPTRSQREGCQIWHKGCKRFSRLPCSELCFRNLLNNWKQNEEEEEGRRNEETGQEGQKTKQGWEEWVVRWEAEDNQDLLMQHNQLKPLCNTSQFQEQGLR